jgi:hypothetical protein
VTPDGDSDHLRDLEEHAAEAKRAQGDNGEGAEEQQAETAEASTGAAPGDEGSDTEYGVENDMRPGGPAAGEADTDGPKKSIDEDVTGDEETEHMSELHTDD